MVEIKINPIRNGWFWCCGKKIQKIGEKTTIIGTVIYCRHCKAEHKVLIVNGKLMDEVI